MTNPGKDDTAQTYGKKLMEQFRAEIRERRIYCGGETRYQREEWTLSDWISFAAEQYGLPMVH
ncbi:MAG TPA: hypothetical protein VMB03_12080 [Bryobacteraceae bacterium]|nr:hypothetical protein [Bryobacteraceae bacterium]